MQRSGVLAQQRGGSPHAKTGTPSPARRSGTRMRENGRTRIGTLPTSVDTQIESGKNVGVHAAAARSASWTPVYRPRSPLIIAVRAWSMYWAPVRVHRIWRRLHIR